MLSCNSFIIRRGASFFPNNLSNKIHFSEYYIAYFPYIYNFIFITANKNNTIISKQISGSFQARIHHAQPVGMEATVTIRVGHKAVACLIFLIGAGKVGFGSFREVVIIDKIIARVVGRVDVDHFDLAEIGLLQELEGVEIVPFDEQVLGGVKVHAFFPAGAQGFGNGGIGRQHGLALARPVQMIALLRAFHDAVGKLLPQKVKIHAQAQGTVLAPGLGHAVGKKLPDTGNMLLRHVRAVHLQFLHDFFSCSSA